MSILSIASELDGQGIGNRIVMAASAAKHTKIEKLEELLNKRVGGPGPGKHWEISSQMGGLMLEVTEDASGGAASFSPRRLPVKAFEEWLRAFIAGYEFARKK